MATLFRNLGFPRAFGPFASLAIGGDLFAMLQESAPEKAQQNDSVFCGSMFQDHGAPITYTHVVTGL